jgi:phospholipid/cholesterol/gamma-HCH transport system ATP-binding protein
MTIGHPGNDAAQPAPAPILQFENVTLVGGHRYESGLWQVSFTLNPGDLMLVRFANEQTRLPLADAAEGMIVPDQGTIRFLGLDWGDLSARQAAVERGRIGRVFAIAGWISDLTVEENLMLAQRHNTNRPEEDIRNEAASLAKLFSLPGLPQGLSPTVRRQDLQRAACVRALMGRPRLLILEEPTAGAYPQIMAPLMASLRSARSRGAAVIWMTDDQEVWNDRGIPATLRCTMSGSQMRVSQTVQSLGASNAKAVP